MPTHALRMLLVGAFALGPACNRGDKDDKKDEKKAADAKTDAKTDAKADEKGEDSLQVAEGDAAVEGPVPPETSMVFFTIEGALLPLACFDKDKKKVLAGDDCLAMVPPGTDVRVASKFSSFNKKAGDKTTPTCLAGEDKKNAIAVEGITAGADFVYATWPPSGIKTVTRAPDEASKPEKTRLGDTEKQKLLGASKVDGEIVGNFTWEVDVDADGKADKLFGVSVPNPAFPEAHKWSGLVLAKGGSLDDLVVIESVKNKPDVFEARGLVDIDGDKKSEIWVRRTSEDGSAGERLHRIGTGDGIGKWTCGAA